MSISKMMRWCAAPVALLTGAVVLGPAPLAAQAAKAAQPGGRQLFDLDVEVVNESDDPVPVAGTVSVGNFPATQSVQLTGTPTVQVAGTPTVNVASMPPIAVASSEQPFQFSIKVTLEAPDPNEEDEECRVFEAAELPAETLLVVDQVVAQTFNAPRIFRQVTFESTMPTPSDDNPTSFFNYIRKFPLTETSNLVAVEEQLVVGPGYADNFQVCVQDNEPATVAFRVNGHLIPAIPPVS